MATITTIQGTDSLSASRLTLNNNFAALNSDVVSLIGLLDITTNNLTNVNAAEVTTLSIDGGQSANFTSALNELDATETRIGGLATLDGGVVYGFENIGAGGMPSNNAFTSSSYIVDGLTAPTVAMNTASDGQEVTLIAEGAQVVVTPGNAPIAGVTASITLDQYNTVTLRYVGTSWYVISASPMGVVIV